MRVPLRGGARERFLVVLQSSPRLLISSIVLLLVHFRMTPEMKYPALVGWTETRDTYLTCDARCTLPADPAISVWLLFSLWNSRTTDVFCLMQCRPLTSAIHSNANFRIAMRQNQSS